MSIFPINGRQTRKTPSVTLIITLFTTSATITYLYSAMLCYRYVGDYLIMKPVRLVIQYVQGVAMKNLRRVSQATFSYCTVHIPLVMVLLYLKQRQER